MSSNNDCIKFHLNIVFTNYLKSIFTNNFEITHFITLKSMDLLYF